MSRDHDNNLERLGLTFPRTLAFLPSNYDTAEHRESVHYSRFTPELERALKGGGIEFETAEEGSDRVYLDARAADWILPVLAVGEEVARNPHAVAVALGVISNYLYDKMKKMGAPRTVRMEIVRERDGERDQIHYEGPVEGLAVLKSWAPKRGKR